MHSGGLDLARLTYYTRLNDNLMQPRDDPVEVGTRKR